MRGSSAGQGSGRAARVLLTLAVAGLSWSAAAAPLTLLTEENPPFNYLQDGKLTGLVAELVLETARRASLPVTLEVLPWRRAYQRARTEANTCLFAAARLESREKLFAWVGPFANNVWAVFGKADFAGSVRRISDLEAYRLGGVVGDAKVEYLMGHGITNIHEAREDRANPPRLFLHSGHPDYIDLWVSGYFLARGVARETGAGEIRPVFILREIPLYLACSPRTAPATLRALAEALAALRDEGLPARIAAEYQKEFVR